ncbi:MAG: hypothetical protein M3044_17975 [Thermoproteota archaeon]|nr:hypothetical protein [Thermoproteota archaeon]
MSRQNMLAVAVSSDNTQQPHCRQQWLVSNSGNNNNTKSHWPTPSRTAVVTIRIFLQLSKD